MEKYYFVFVIFFCGFLRADFLEYSQMQLNLMQYNKEGHNYPLPNITNCYEILNKFGEYASNFTFCSILNARPVTVCERCVDQFVNFHDKYQELLNTVNGTSCRSIFLSQDRLNVIEEYHDNILSVWNKGNCNGCFNWTQGLPSLKNDITTFHKKLNDTRDCIRNYTDKDVCNRCMQSYIQLDDFYKSLSSDSIGVDSICMDIVDAMNATRSHWSKHLNCCKLRKTPEVVFLCCAGIISFLPLIYYLVLRFCGPIRDLPNVLKQSRFKQTILGSINRRSE